MINSAQLRGMLLEEALLFLLQSSGYRTVEKTDDDETIINHPAGLAVKGRGCDHQIDAIADFAITPPFTYPLRLLVEAKCYHNPIGIDVARNSFGVLRDVEEYWVPSKKSAIQKKRYHYQYAIASLTGFTKSTQHYAYAHDIYLLPLGRAEYFSNIKRSINSFQEMFLLKNNFKIQKLSEIRKIFRASLKNVRENQVQLYFPYEDLFFDFFKACQQTSAGIMGLLDQRVPVLFIPNRKLDLRELEDQDIRIYWHHYNDHIGWFISSIDNDKELFSFDIPVELLTLYYEDGLLTRNAALDLKERFMSKIQLFIETNHRVRIVTLSLDMDWINNLRRIE